MKNSSFHAARAFLLVALPLSAIAASAQTLRSSVTTFDQNGNAIIVPTAGDENRSSVTTFDRNGVPKIIYTSPPSTPYLSGIQQPQSIAALIANQNLYGQSAPNPNPGAYTRFSYSNGPIYPPGYYPYPSPYPAPGYAYPVPGYPAPGYVYPTQQQGYSANFNDSNRPWTIPNNVTSIPLSPGYGGYGYQQGYQVPTYPSYPYPYPAPGYAYPAPGYSYGGYGYPGGYYSSNSTGYGVSFGRGGFSASIGGSNTTSRSSSTTIITTR